MSLIQDSWYSKKAPCCFLTARKVRTVEKDDSHGRNCERGYLHRLWRLPGRLPRWRDHRDRRGVTTPPLAHSKVHRAQKRRLPHRRGGLLLHMWAANLERDPWQLRWNSSCFMSWMPILGTISPQLIDAASTRTNRLRRASGLLGSLSP